MNPKQRIFAILCEQLPGGGIGINNDLLYQSKELPGDMYRFKKYSIGENGNVNIMGRKNYDSIPEKFKPFGDNRINIIVSKNEHPKISAQKNCFVIHDPILALQFAQIQYPDRDIAIIGGAEIYHSLFPYCDMIYATDVEGARKADTFVKIPESFSCPFGSYPLHEAPNGQRYCFPEYTNQNIQTVP